MQIKLRGKKYQLLRYAGYSSEKKRATVEVIGSIDDHATSIPDDLVVVMQSNEIEQLTTFLREKAEADTNLTAKYSLLSVALVLSKAQLSLENGEKPGNVDAIYEAMKSFKKAMKKAGYGPVRGEPEQAPAAPGQQSLLAGQPTATAS